MPTKNRSPKMTDEIAAQIKWLWECTPLNQAQISAVMGAINQGRVSEVITGARFSDVKPKPIDGWDRYA